MKFSRRSFGEGQPKSSLKSTLSFAKSLCPKLKGVLMPVHDGSRSDQERGLVHPDQNARTQPKTACPRQSIDGEVVGSATPAIVDEEPGFQGPGLHRKENADQPAEGMSERHNHGKNFSGKIRIDLFAKSFIL
jgi:hypothetical protein